MSRSRILALSLVSVMLCAFPVFAQKNNRCGTGNLSADEEATLASEIENNFGRKVSVVIPVWVHVISSGPGFTNGEVPDKMIKDQIAVLNSTYAAARGGAVSGFGFKLIGVDRTENADWFF